MTFGNLVQRAVSTYQRKCPKCPLDRKDFVPSAIVPGAQLTFIGEAPGENEVAQRIPFVGKAGQRLRYTLRQVGIHPESCSFQNVVSCRPPNNDTPDNRVVKLCGKKHLPAELAAMGPKLVVLLGASAFGYFFSRREWGRLRGNFVTSGRYTFLPTWHPSYVNRMLAANPADGQRVYESFRKDLDKARRFLDGTLYFDRKYDLVKTETEALKWSRFLREQKLLSIDIENHPLNRWEPNARILTISFSWKRKVGICFPIDHHEVEDEHFKQICRRAVASVLKGDSAKIWHNIKHDVPWLRDNGYEVNGKQICSMSIAYLTDENRRSFGLKQLSAELLEGYRDLFEPTQYVPLDRMGYYNCEDTDNALGVYETLYSKMDDALWWVHDNIMVPAALAFAEAEKVGIHVDIPRLRQLQRELTAESKAIVQACNRQLSAGRTITSPDDLRYELFERMKLPAVSHTEKGTVQVNASSLTILHEDYGCELAGEVLKMRKIDKLVNTYLDPYPDWVDHESRVHSSFRMTGTVTGRPTSERPNTFNIPRDVRVRSLFTRTPRPGWKLFYGDLSNAEMRVAGSLARDPVLIEAFKNDADVHSLMGAKLIMIPFEEFDKEGNPEHKEWRQRAKPVNFGLLYGQLEEGFINYARAQFGVVFSMSDATRFRQIYFETYTGLQPWYREVWQELYAYGSVRTELGRIRRFPGLHQMKEWERHEAERKAVNMLVQSLAADLTTMLFIHVQNYLIEHQMQMRLVLTVYDSIMGDGPEEEIPEVARVVDDFVSSWDYPWLRVPMKIDLEFGDRWGETKKLKRGEDF